MNKIILKPETTFTISKNIVFKKQKDGNFMLIEIEGDRLFELSDVSAHVWELVQEARSLEEIHASVEEEYETDDQSMKEVDEFILELISSEILTVRN